MEHSAEIEDAAKDPSTLSFSGFCELMDLQNYDKQQALRSRSLSQTSFSTREDYDFKTKRVTDNVESCGP